MPRILLVGKGSFIGSNFIKFSRFKDVKEVGVIDVKPEDIDLTGFDVVIHLAAIVHQSKSIDFEQYLKVNTLLPVNMANHSKRSGVKQFIFLSTTKVYGKFEAGQNPWYEHSECIPNDSYGISKLKAENELVSLSSDSFSVTIIRTPLVYGEGVKANMLSLIKLVERMPILPFQNVSARRSMTYVGNLVEYIDRTIELTKSGVFIAKDQESISIEELIRLISKSLGKRVILFDLGSLLIKLLRRVSPSNHERLFGSSLLNNSKTLEILNFVPKTSINEGIDRTVSYYLKSKH